MHNGIKILDCNIGYGADIEKIATMLKKYMTGDFVITLQEVSENKKNRFAELLGDMAESVYSLDYRRPGKYDGRNRVATY